MPFYSKRQHIIQKATLEDAPALTRFARYAFLETYISLAPHREEEIKRYVNKDFTLSGITLDLQNSAFEFFLLKECFLEEEILLGYAKVNHELTTPSIDIPNTTCIERFYIHPEHKQKGLGSKLMKHILHHLKHQEIEIVWLSVWDINLAVLKFYEQFGFRQAGIHLFDMGDSIDEDILLVKHF